MRDKNRQTNRQRAKKDRKKNKKPPYLFRCVSYMIDGDKKVHKLQSNKSDGPCQGGVDVHVRVEVIGRLEVVHDTLQETHIHLVLHLS